MHSYLIIADENKQDTAISNLAKNEGAKILNFSLQKIADAKELKKITKYFFSEKTAIVIKNINNATNEALNSLLKNLEEPNSNIIYILTSTSIESIIPTIVSRCQIVKTKKDSKENIDDFSEIINFLKLNTNRKIEYVNKLREREVAINFIEKLIKYLHSKSEYQYLENAIKCLKNLKLNGNISLQLIAFIVTMDPAYVE